jgi:hypothetical protein
MPAGRPTKYNEEILDKAKEYLNVYETLGDVIPSIEGLSLHLDIVRSTIYDWEGQEGKEEFSDILRKINAKQHQVLVNKGLSNDFNSAITKLVLGKHGYHEKQQQEISGPKGKPIQTASVINFIPVSRDDK